MDVAKIRQIAALIDRRHSEERKALFGAIDELERLRRLGLEEAVASVRELRAARQLATLATLRTYLKGFLGLGGYDSFELAAFRYGMETACEVVDSFLVAGHEKEEEVDKDKTTGQVVVENACTRGSIESQRTLLAREIDDCMAAARLEGIRSGMSRAANICRQQRWRRLVAGDCADVIICTIQNEGGTYDPDDHLPRDKEEGKPMTIESYREWMSSFNTDTVPIAKVALAELLNELERLHRFESSLVGEKAVKKEEGATGGNR